MSNNLFGEEKKGTLKIKVTGIVASEGDIHVGLFSTKKDYKNKSNQYRKGIYPVTGKELIITYKEVKYGEYAIIIFHDINKNDTMDSNSLGLPKEPFGFSNDATPGLSAPAYSRVTFLINKEEVLHVVKLQTFNQRWSIGLAPMVSTSPYKEAPAYFTPIPILAYQGDRLNIIGPDVTYSICRYKEMKLNLGVRFNFNGYNEDDSDALKGMEDKYYSLDGGLEWRYKIWELDFKISGYYDLLGINKGFNGQVMLSHKIEKDKLIFEMGAGFNWMDDQFVDYYFGVDASERSSGRSEYHPHFSINPSLSVWLFYKFTQHWILVSLLTVEHFDAEIVDSPILDDSVRGSFLLGVVYRF